MRSTEQPRASAPGFHGTFLLPVAVGELISFGEMRRPLTIVAVVLVLLIAGASLLYWRFFSLTGHFFPKKIEDSLVAPVRVIAAKEDGLLTSDGRTLLPPLIA